MEEQALSTRLFPKSLGADKYRMTGVAKRCDWVLLSDETAPHIHLHKNRVTEQPNHIFLSLRSPFKAIEYFTDNILPRLRSGFVLVTGSEDITIPRQTDRRWRRFNLQERQALDRILNHPHLIHWYAENLDLPGDQKRSPLPLGLVFPDGIHHPVTSLDVPSLSQRQQKAFCGHRIRSGPQWEHRRCVSELARSSWQTFCTLSESELTEAEFVREICAHRFVMCVDGGGLDPSPKAWTALQYGAIPIIRRTPLVAAYAHLPIAVVDDWTAQSLSPNRLEGWYECLGHRFDNPQERKHVLHCLTLEYWWRYIDSGLPIRAPAGSVHLPPE